MGLAGAGWRAPFGSRASPRPTPAIWRPRAQRVDVAGSGRFRGEVGSDLGRSDGERRSRRGSGACSASAADEGGNAMSLEVGAGEGVGLWDRLRPATCLGLAIACCVASRLPGGHCAPLGGAPVASMASVGKEGGAAGRAASIASAVDQARAKKKISWQTAMQYRVQKVMMKKLGGKLLAVAMVALPIILVGGVAYRLTTGHAWYLSFFRAYLLMGGVPGGNASDENNHAATIVTNVIFLYGLLTFAVVLGVICEDISTFVTTVRNGNTDVVEEGHTVVLNVNQQLPAVLRQMSVAKRERRHGTFSKPVVIMADVDKSELDAYVRRVEGDVCNLEVYTRHGNINDPADLLKAAADQAQTIILLQPEGEDTATIAAKRTATIASLKALGTGGNGRKTQLVVQTPEKKSMMEGFTNVTMASNTPPLPEGSKLEIVEMHAAQTLDRLLSHCALQPGLGSVYSDILEQGEGMEFYVETYPSLAGAPHHALRKHFDAAAVCGYIKGDGVVLNPSENEIYNGEDQVVLLAQSYDKVKPLAAPLPSSPDWVKNIKRSYEEKVSKNIMVLGWSDKFDGMIDALDELAPKGTRVSVVCSKRPSFWRKKHRNVRVRYVEGNPASFCVLEKAGLHKCDSIIMAGLQDIDANTADAQVLSTVLQIEDLNSKRMEAKPIHVVATINQPRTKDVANHLVGASRKNGSRSSLDLLLPAELSSGVLTQVAAQPRLLHVVRDLMNASKIELYIRHCKDYELTGRGAISWQDVTDAVRANGETAIGFIDGCGQSYTAPTAASRHAYEDGDSIVVLAGDYVPVEDTQNLS
eukprot:evm.model.scf_1298.2 EVM.evm.TU.scf_1298.2   scf_1298:4839-10953(-)